MFCDKMYIKVLQAGKMKQISSKRHPPFSLSPPDCTLPQPTVITEVMHKMQI
jgi:hypothetical protein